MIFIIIKATVRDKHNVYFYKGWKMDADNITH